MIALPLRMPFLGCVRDQGFEPDSKQFGSCIAKQCLSADIGEPDSLVGIDYEDRVRRAFHYAAPSLLGLLKRCDIRDRADVTKKDAICAEAWQTVIQHPGVFAV